MPPEFADDQDPVTDDNQADAAREVAENTAAGIDIGAPVVAEDADADVLTYTLEGTDEASFDIDWATGQLKTKGSLDADGGETSYTVIGPGHGPGWHTRPDSPRSHQRHRHGEHHRHGRERASDGDRRR